MGEAKKLPRGRRSPRTGTSRAPIEARRSPIDKEQIDAIPTKEEADGARLNRGLFYKDQAKTQHDRSEALLHPEIVEANQLIGPFLYAAGFYLKLESRLLGVLALSYDVNPETGDMSEAYINNELKFKAAAESAVMEAEAIVAHAPINNTQ